MDAAVEKFDYFCNNCTMMFVIFVLFALADCTESILSRVCCAT